MTLQRLQYLYLLQNSIDLFAVNWYFCKKSKTNTVKIKVRIKNSENKKQIYMYRMSNIRRKFVNIINLIEKCEPILSLQRLPL